MKKIITVLACIAVLFIVAITFIHFTNDHKECLNVEEVVYSKNGSKKKMTNKHICNEKYNL
ncbi:hypothetical protein [uncultured Lacinutrix sp.]|uniref:hypothetical protein n=1 Tax=uncultured Lacinutrix sp. TaxID=574032 RepID=UPI00262E2180|nr:hypothetical protein [uncultured Lacinutrix sp.]